MLVRAIAKTLICVLIGLGSLMQVQAQSGMIDIDFQTIDPSACNQTDGEIHLIPLNGMAPFEYSIDGGATFQSDSIFTGLGIGTYILFVRDAQQQFSSFKLAKLRAEGAPSIRGIVMVDATECGMGGSLKILTEGGIGNLQYSIDSGRTFQPNFVFSNVPSGTYHVVVRNEDESCSVTYPTVSFAPQSPLQYLDVQVVTVNPDCDMANGELTVNVIGGSGGYLYSSDNGVNFQAANTFENLVAETYNIIVRDTISNCEKGPVTSVFLENQNCRNCNDVQINISKTEPDCKENNGEIALTVTGGSGNFSYSVNDGESYQTDAIFDSLAAGMYPIKVRDNDFDCEKAALEIITLAPTNCPDCDSLAIQSFLTLPDCDSLNGRIELTVSGGSRDYDLNINGGTFQNNLTFDNLGNGSYVVMVIDRGTNCEKTFSAINLPEQNCLTPLSDTIRIDTTITITEVDTICFATYLMDETITSITPTCEGQSPSVGFEVNNLNNCLVYEGLMLGQDTLCLAVCDADTVCQEVIITVTVLDTMMVDTMVMDTMMMDTMMMDTMMMDTMAMDTSCQSLFFEQMAVVEIMDCDSNGQYCLNLLKEDLANYELTINRDLFTENYPDCDVPEQASLFLPEGIYELILQEKSGSCSDTATLTIECLPSPNTFEDTIFVNEMDTFCLDSLKLVGTIATIENTCEDAAGEMVVFNLDSLNNCLIYTGIESGSDDACITFCDSLGNCDSIIVTIVVEEEPDTIPFPIAVNDRDTVEEGKIKTINVLENDTTNSTLITVTVIESPTNGLATVNADLTITYMANDNICDTTDFFTYELCNPRGCDTARVDIAIICKVFIIFNGFSPNDDGVNETFTIEGIEDFPNNRVQIFNRWGNMVFEQQGYKGQWDGTWNNQKLPDGTYFYLLNDGAGKNYSGFLQIQR